MPRVSGRPSDINEHDCSPWSHVSSSSRVSAYRYDYANRALQVQWENGLNHGYVYGIDEDLDYETYRRFAYAVSKGKSVNRILNDFSYDLMTSDEVSAPSNSTRKGLQSRRVKS